MINWSIIPLAMSILKSLSCFLQRTSNKTVFLIPMHVFMLWAILITRFGWRELDKSRRKGWPCKKTDMIFWQPCFLWDQHFYFAFLCKIAANKKCIISPLDWDISAFFIVPWIPLILPTLEQHPRIRRWIYSEYQFSGLHKKGTSFW